MVTETIIIFIPPRIFKPFTDPKQKRQLLLLSNCLGQCAAARVEGEAPSGKACVGSCQGGRYGGRGTRQKPMNIPSVLRSSVMQFCNFT